MSPQRPGPEEHLPYFSRYIDLVPDGDVVAMMQNQLEPIIKKLETLSPEQANHRYAEGKWSVLEVLGHLSDTERVFTFRALHFARGDGNPLPGFDQDAWANNVDFAARDLSSILFEWRGVRQAAVSLFGNLSSEAWLRRGVASGHAMSPRACAYIIVGHLIYHQQFFRERYGLDLG